MWQMAHILVLDSIDQDIFICGFCKSVYNSLQFFLDHKRTCAKYTLEKLNITSQSQNEIYAKCTLEELNITAQSQNEIVSLLPQVPVEQQHTFINDDKFKEDISCKMCKKKFKEEKTLLSHVKSHSTNIYQCPVCGRCFQQNSHLQRHIMCHKVWPDGLSETTAKTTEVELLSYACSYCGLTLSNYSQFRAHLKNHVTLKKFKCIQGDCVAFYNTIEDLISHVTISHNVSSYSCYICNDEFNSLEEIAIHYQNHTDRKNEDKTNKKQYKCLQCDATFRRPDRLSLHKLTEDHKKHCIHCNKTFSSDKRLRLHLQIHQKMKPYKCAICNSSFHMKKYLSTHMLKHGERQYSCTICKNTFKRHDLLQRHMKLHQIRKLLKCPFKDSLGCKKEFSRNDKLKSHMKSHTKHLGLSSISNKSVHNNDSSTVEICIVPLDSKRTDY